MIGIIASMLVLKRLFGVDARADAKALERRLSSRPVALERQAARVTNPRLAGALLSRAALVAQPLEELRIVERFRVQLTRVRRGETELPPLADLRLSVGDLVHVVGAPEAVAALAAEAGDAPKELEEPHLLPVFVGIALGVFLGSVPLPVPGLATPVRIGLAGGVLLVALAFARLQRWGPLLFYLPRAASSAIKDLGIAIFSLRSG